MRSAARASGCPKPVKVSIIIPVYNEFSSLPQVVERVLAAPIPAGCEKEIIIVDDGSTDGTTRLLDGYVESGVVVVHRSVLNFGKGTAVRVGLAMATGEIVLIQDGDLEYDPRDYVKLVQPILDGKADVVYGSRFLSKPKGMAAANWLANKILTHTANLLYGAGITDEATAYKAFRADILKPIRLECRRFEFCPEVTAKVRLAGHRIHEAPISYNPRGIAEGKKIRARDGFEALWTLIKYRIGADETAAPHRPPVRVAWPWSALVALLTFLSLAIYIHSAAGRMLIAPAAWTALFSSLGAIAAKVAPHRFVFARYVFQSYAGALALLAADLVFGLALLRLIGRRAARLPSVLGAATALTLGSGAAGCGMVLLGMLHAIGRPGAIALSAAMGLFGVVVLTRERAWRSSFAFLRAFRVSPANRKVAWLCGAAMAPVLLIHAMDLLMPVIEYDSGMYHMSAARLYRETGQLTFDPGLRYNAQPHLATLLYLRHWLVMDDDCVVKLANVEFSVILLLAFAAAARELRMRDGWILAAAFFLTSPNVWWTAKIEYLDYAIAAYFAVAAVLLCRQLRVRGSLAIYIGAALAFVSASKFLGMALSAMTALAYVAVAIVVKRDPASRTVRRLLLIGAIVAAVGLPWWVRSWQHTGSPLYPFFAPSAAADQQTMMAFNRAFGAGHSPGVFVTIGYWVATMLPYGYGDPYGFGPGLLLLEGLVVAALVVKRRRPSPAALFAGLAATLYLLFWFTTGQVLRYLVPAMPLFTILFLASIRRLGFDRRLPAAALLLLTLLDGHAALEASTMRKAGEAPPVTYAERRSFLRSVLPYYPAVESLNRIAPSGRTYLLFTQPARYYLTGPSEGDWFYAYSYPWLFGGGASAEQSLDRLANAGFHYLLADRQAPQWPGSTLARYTETGGARLKPLYGDDRFSAFEIR
jgi:dolichol-phosphate mannosyltransferase